MILHADSLLQSSHSATVKDIATHFLSTFLKTNHLKECKPGFEERKRIRFGMLR